MYLINPEGRKVEVLERMVPELVARGFRVGEPQTLKGFSFPEGVKPADVGRLVAVYSVYNEIEYMEANLRNVYPVVDWIVVLVNTHPWSRSVAECPPDGTLRALEQFPDPEGKIDLYVGDFHDATHGGQLAQRTFGMSLLKPGDWYWLIDGDEFTPPEMVEEIRLHTATAEADCLQLYFYTLWQTFQWVGWEEWVPRLYRYRPGARFIAPCTVADETGTPYSVGRIPMEKVHTLHCGYVRSDARMMEKMGLYAARSKRGDFYGGFNALDWWNEKWLGWRQAPDACAESVHPAPAYTGAINAGNGPQPLPEKVAQTLPMALLMHPYAVTAAASAGVDRSVSIIVVTYKSDRPLVKMLDDLVATTACRGLVHELIWIDNGSHDRGAVKAMFEAAAAALPCDLKCRLNIQNWMFTKAVNQGLKLATGRYILLLNPDVELPDANWLAQLIDDLEATPRGGVAGCKMLHRDGTIHHAGGVFDGQRGVHIGRDEEDRGQYDTLTTVAWVTGACFLMKREVYIALGTLDEKYEHFESDNRYCLAAHQAGFEVVYSPATIVHDAGQSVQAPLEEEG